MPASQPSAASEAPKTGPMTAWTPSDWPLSSLFVSNDAPLTLDNPQWIADLFRWAQTMPNPPGNRGRVSALGGGTGSDFRQRGRHAPLLRLPRFHPRVPRRFLRHPGRFGCGPALGEVASPHDPARIQQSWSRPRSIHPAHSHVPSRRHPRRAAVDAQPRVERPCSASAHACVPCVRRAFSCSAPAS